MQNQWYWTEHFPIWVLQKPGYISRSRSFEKDKMLDIAQTSSRAISTSDTKLALIEISKVFSPYKRSGVLTRSYWNLDGTVQRHRGNYSECCSWNYHVSSNLSAVNLSRACWSLAVCLIGLSIHLKHMPAF